MKTAGGKFRFDFWSAALAFSDPSHAKARSTSPAGCCAWVTTLDWINALFGTSTLHPGIAGQQEPRGWAMKRGNKSPAYTTRWAELARATLK
ncbi:DUF4113 domain-containing protein [Acidithiobacillus thiooxidans]|uniref:DUF4113 domain-containing protein n=1 Tax=Acidithiobacillus thiooxidans TaxID=930 RepID=UPI001D00DB60|nr:DUF4113 domain-containing protein [Acidithiobacillus thiooxidans]